MSEENGSILWYPLGIRISDLERKIKVSGDITTIFRKIIFIFDSWHKENLGIYPGKYELDTLRYLIVRGGKYRWKSARSFCLVAQRDHFLGGDVGDNLDQVICFYTEPTVKKDSELFQLLVEKSVSFNDALDKFLAETFIEDDRGNSHVLGIPSRGFNFYRVE